MRIKCLFVLRMLIVVGLFVFFFLREDSYFNLFFYCPVDHDRCVFGGGVGEAENLTYEGKVDHGR